MTAVSSSIVGPAPGSAARLDSQRLLDLAGHLQAVADPTRLRLLAVVLAAPAQTACVRDITTAAGLAQPMVSHHLQILHRAALVTRIKRGSYVYYQADTAALTHLAHQLTALSNGDPSRRRSVTAAPATTVAGCSAWLCTISEASGSDRPAVQ